MTESAAICQYLVSKFSPSPLNVDRDEPMFGSFLNWLHFGEATLTFPQTLVLRYGRLEPEDRRNPQVVEDYKRWFFGRLRAVEAALGQAAHLCAGRFTAADISVGYALLLAVELRLDDQFGFYTKQYWDGLQQRAGFRRAKAAQTASATSET
jgi:glutathione S-transferase